MNLIPVQILLMEDDLGDMELIREGLQDAKISLKLNHVTDGLEGMRYLRKEGPYQEVLAPDIILLDLNMPRKDGREVLQEIKADKEFRKIPVVVLTTSDAETDIVRSYDLGANCYIKKPLGLEEFIKVVQTFEEFWLTMVKLPSAK